MLFQQWRILFKARNFNEIKFKKPILIGGKQSSIYETLSRNNLIVTTLDVIDEKQYYTGYTITSDGYFDLLTSHDRQIINALFFISGILTPIIINGVTRILYN